MSRSIRILLSLLAVLALSVAVAACGDDDDDAGSGSATTGQTETAGGEATAIQPIEGAESVSITVGSKNFDEQFVLGEIYAQALEAAGYNVEKDLNLGSEVVAFRSLQQGEVDAYPEYTGTALTSFFDVKIEDVPKDQQQAYEDARAAYAEENITAYPPTPFENTYRIGITNAKAEELGNPTKISDLEGDAQNMTINGFPECRQRVDCLLGVEQQYGLDFERFLPGDNPYQVLRSGDADAAFVFTTDGPLASGDFVVLDDDKAIFPPYNITFAVRDEVAEQFGEEGAALIESVQQNLTEDVMQELNARVSVDREEPEAVAGAYLKQFGYVQ